MQIGMNPCRFGRCIILHPAMGLFPLTFSVMPKALQGGTQTLGDGRFLQRRLKFRKGGMQLT